MKNAKNTMDKTEPATALLIEDIEALLPQLQCRKCGFSDCRGYAKAVACGEADINRCTPGEDWTIAALAARLERPLEPLNRSCPEHRAGRAVIVEADCIGCARCLPVCPTRAIIGAPRQLHTVLTDECTGCELCVPVCPVDCILWVPADGPMTPWPAWSQVQATRAQQRYHELTQRSGLTCASDPGRELRRREIREAVARVRHRHKQKHIRVHVGTRKVDA